MRILAWDTSSKVGSVAALEWVSDPLNRQSGNVRLLSEWTLNMEALHSERLLWVIHQILESSNWSIEEIDLFGVGLGPGSFTGLRIGLTTARTLAHSLQKPLVGVSSLAALVRPAALWSAAHDQKSGNRTLVIGVVDAFRGEVFSIWGTSRLVAGCVIQNPESHSELWKRGVMETVYLPSDLSQEIKKKLQENKEKSRWLMMGEASEKYSELTKGLPVRQRVTSEVPFSDHVHARFIGQLAWEASQIGMQSSPLNVFPRYLRPSSAELKREEMLSNDLKEGSVHCKAD